MWRQKLAGFISQFDHPGWGIAHSERVYAMALKLAEQQGTNVDEDALLAAAYLHDVGEIEPYKQAGMDHAELSAAFAEEMLVSSSFPSRKIPLVKKIIRGHMFYAKPHTSTEAVVFRDADILDYLGAVGITRMLSIVGIDDRTPTLGKAISMIQRFSQELPDQLRTRPAKKIGKVRQAEMATFLAALSRETDDLETL
jgi:uncharacterized protein